MIKAKDAYNKQILSNFESMGKAQKDVEGLLQNTLPESMTGEEYNEVEEGILEILRDLVMKVQG